MKRDDGKGEGGVMVGGWVMVGCNINITSIHTFFYHSVQNV